jgi:glutaredoxin
MDIKKVKPSGEWKSGKYVPVNSSKYIGDINNIIYRSSWERKFCQYCDLKPEILKWSSEPASVKYWNPVDKKEHTYHMDFYIKVKKGENQEDWFIEIKPESQYALDKKPEEIKGQLTEKKVRSYNERMRIWITNRAKMEAAKRYAESIGYKFGTIDEKFLFG